VRHRLLSVFAAIVFLFTTFTEVASAQLVSTNGAQELLGHPSANRVRVSVDVASAYFFDSGYVVSDGLVIQPAFFFTNGRQVLPLRASFWGNYAMNQHGPMTVDEGFTEIDLAIGTMHVFDSGVEVFADLKTSQYPNMEGWNGVEFLNLKLQRAFGLLSVGSRVKYLLTGGYSNDMQLIPFVLLSVPVGEDITGALHVQACYGWNEGAAPDAWTACTITARLSWRQYSIYGKRVVQMDDAITRMPSMLLKTWLSESGGRRGGNRLKRHS